MIPLKQTCDCCNNDDLPIHVACSSLGAMSFAYCLVCLAMGAEPGFILRNMKEEGMIDNPTSFCLYNFSKDSYEDINGNLIPIVTESELSYKTRSAYVETIKDKLENKS